MDPSCDPFSPSPAPRAPGGQQPTYTTVGSVYKPQSATPLQPPTRRARRGRWQPPPSAHEFGLLQPGSVVENLAFRATFSSPPPTSTPGSVLARYSPLRQNYDRAVNPETSDQSSEDPFEIRVALPPFKPLTKPMPSGPSLHPSAMVQEATDAPENDNGDTESSSPAAAAIHKNLATMFNAKTLTNLASYPNPMQIVAQKTLARARTANLDTLNAPRTVDPSSPTPHQSLYAASDVKSLGLDKPLPTPTLRPFQSDPSGFPGIAGVPEARTVPNQLSSVVDSFQTEVDKEKLTRDRGVPQPLAAGPPGRRQYKASTFATTVKALQESANNVKSEWVDEPAQPRSFGPVGQGRPSPPSTTAGRSGSSESASDLSVYEPKRVALASLACPPLFDEGVMWRRKRMVETLPREERARYYKPLPADSVDAYIHTSEDWTDNYPLSRPGSCQKSPEELAAYNTRLNCAFYSGTQEYGKSTSRIIADAEVRIYNQTAGKLDLEERLRRLRRASELFGLSHSANTTTTATTSRTSDAAPVSLEDGQVSSAAETAEPLLNRLFATLFQLVEEKGAMMGAAGYQEPPAWLVDTTKGGQKSFFGDAVVAKAGQRKKKPARQVLNLVW